MCVLYTGSLKGNIVSSPIFKFICWGLGISLGILGLVIWGYVLSWAFAPWSVGFVTFTLLVHGLYFSGITVPTTWAMFSFKEGDVNQV